MRICARVLLVAIAVLLGAAGSAQTQTPAGVDTFKSGGRVVLQIGDQMQTVNLQGPTTVRRGEPMDTDGDGKLDTIQTEILMLDLQGQIGNVPIIFRAGSEFDLQPARGKIDAHFDRKGNFAFGLNRYQFTDARFSIFGGQNQEIHGNIANLEVEAWITSLPPNKPRVGPLTIPRLDHFKCYSVKPLKGFKPQSVSLADQFEPAQAKVVRPLSLCAPVSKNRAKLRSPALHLKCYGIQQKSEKPKKAELDVSVTNQFGEQTLTVLQPQSLCAPSLKSRVVKGTARPFPRVVPDNLLDHFKCYDVKAKGAFKPRVVFLADQFEAERERVLRPIALCNAVDKNRVGVIDKEAHLVFYAIQDLSPKPEGDGRQVVVVKNQFGEETLDVREELALAVPSGKKPPCSEYAERTKAALLAQGRPFGTLNEAIHRPFQGEKGSPCE